MTRLKRSTSAKVAALMLPFALTVAACGSDKSDSSSSSSGSKTTTTMSTSDGGSSSSSTDMSSTTMAGGSSDMAKPTGAGCAAVPTSGKGSFSGMAQDPVGTAASNNPALKTLVAAVTKAGLVDTLNGAGPYTVFAPIDSAFAKIPKGTLDKVLADKATLTKILTYHVVPQRIEPKDLGGTYKTVEGQDLKVSGSAPSFNVGDGQATVVCAGVQTANATVYLIDTVLMPPAM